MFLISLLFHILNMICSFLRIKIMRQTLQVIKFKLDQLKVVNKVGFCNHYTNLSYFCICYLLNLSTLYS